MLGAERRLVAIWFYAHSQMDSSLGTSYVGTDHMNLVAVKADL